MKSWQEALKIVLIQIKLPVAELAEMTGTNYTSINKFIQGKNNSTAKTVQSWLEACERYHKGSWKMFHLICADHIKGEPDLVEIEEKPKPKKLIIEEHVEAWSSEEVSDYLAAIAKRLRKDTKKAESSYQPKEVSSPDNCESELTETQM